MYDAGYTPKLAMQDMFRFLAYRVHHPSAEPTKALQEAEQRLQSLNSTELLDVVRTALVSGIRPGIAQVSRLIEDREDERSLRWPIRY